MGETNRSAALSDAPARPVRGRSASPRQGRIALDVLDTHLGYWARRFQVSVFQDFIRTLESIDLRPVQYSVLVVIGANPGLSQSDLADTLGIERARLVRLLDLLEKRGFTRRRPSFHDRRSHALHLTAEGQRILKQAKVLAAEHEARLAQRLGEEHHQAMLGCLRGFTG